MSNPYPPQPPRKFARSTSNRIIGGVCGGVAQYLNMDANLVRILTVLITLFTGVPVILYIIALFLVPEDTAPPPPGPPPVTGTPTYSGPFSATEAATPPPAYAPYPGAAGGAQASRPTAEDVVWGTEGPPWEQRQPEAAQPADEPAAAAQPVQATPAPESVQASPAPEPVQATPAPEPEPEPVAPAEPEAPVVPPSEDKPPS